LTTSDEIISMSIDINIKINEAKTNSSTNTNELNDNSAQSLQPQYEIDLFIPTRKTFSLNLNPNENVISIFQHKVHNNKYFVISIDNGNVLY